MLPDFLGDELADMAASSVTNPMGNAQLVFVGLHCNLRFVIDRGTLLIDLQNLRGDLEVWHPIEHVAFAAGLLDEREFTEWMQALGKIGPSSKPFCALRRAFHRQIFAWLDTHFDRLSAALHFPAYTEDIERANTILAALNRQAFS